VLLWIVAIGFGVAPFYIGGGLLLPSPARSASAWAARRCWASRWCVATAARRCDCDGCRTPPHRDHLDRDPACAYDHSDDYTADDDCTAAALSTVADDAGALWQKIEN